MAVIELIEAEQAPLLVRDYFADGDPGPIVAALAQVPEFLEVAMPFVARILGPTSLPPRTKELVILRASVRGRCRFCIDSHTLVAVGVGMSRAEVTALREESPFPESFSAAERAVVAFADDLCDRPARATDHLKPHFEDHQIVELVTVGATTILLNRMATALGLTVSPDAASRLEAGRWDVS